MATIRIIAEIEAKDVTAVRQALKAAGAPATVKRGRGSTRYTLTVSTRLAVNTGQISQIVEPLGFSAKRPAHYPTTQHYFEIVEGEFNHE